MKEKIDEIVHKMQVHLLGINCNCDHCKRVRELYVNEILALIASEQQTMVEALEAAKPCLEDWIRVTACGTVWQRDTEALAKIDAALKGEGK